MSSMTVKVSVPASSANLGPGFDVLGLSLNLRNTVSVAASERDTVTITGEGSQRLAHRHHNLVVRSMDHFYEHIGAVRPALEIGMTNIVPLSRGLGSSSAAIVGGLWAANLFSGAGLSKEEVFPLAVELEGHPDNVAAALFGGLTVAYKSKAGYAALSLKPSERLRAVLLIPSFKLSTAAARKALPERVSYQDAVFNISRSCLLISLLTGQSGVPDRLAFEDRLHQPYRAGLIEDFNDILEECYAAGAIGAALSGAGPTVIAFADDKKVVQVELALREKFSPRYQVLSLEIDLEGATTL